MIYLMTVTSFLALAAAALLTYSLYRFRTYERRITQMELMIVRSVLEENPKIVSDVIATQKALYGSLSGTESLRQARRLHGLEP